MEKHQISENFYYVDTKDRGDQLIRIVVFRLENGTYEAFSSYFPNVNIVGYATSYHDKQALTLSIKDLKKWKLESKLKAAANLTAAY